MHTMVGTSSVWKYALVLVLGLLLVKEAEAVDYQLVTGHLPPWSMLGNKTYPGSFVEIVEEALSRTKHKADIKVYPWSRSQSLALSQPNVVIFPIARTPEREKLYKWVAPIKKMRLSFVSVSGKPLDEKEARKLSRILVHKDAPPQSILMERGFDNLIPMHDISPNIAKILKFRRVDAWFTPEDMAAWLWKFSTDVEPPVIGTPLSEHTLYVAASLNTSDEIVNELASTLQGMRADGTIRKILARYGASEE